MEKEISSHKIKINGYSNRKRIAKLEKKREEAELRNKVYSLLSKQEKIDRIKKQKGDSKRQLLRFVVKKWKFLN